MHAAFVQSSLKFINMLHNAKSQLVRLYSTKQGAKAKNYYDTLKITPHATQNEVKSAYYKLTLQYHPDKNNSEYAKQKFHDISEAYGVLGDHEQRKIYDRSVMLRRQPTMSTTAEEPISYYKDKVYSGSSKIYNFDAWTQAHYGKQMHAGRLRRQMYEREKAIREMQKSSEDNSQIMQIAVLLFTLVLIAVLLKETVDVPAFRRYKKKSKDNEN